MKSMDVTRTSKMHRASIGDLSIVGSELSDDHLQLASGGAVAAASGGLVCVCVRVPTCRPNSSTFCNDQDYGND